MVERFSESQMKRLAEIYREHECLWNNKNIYYKDRSVRENAYLQICSSLNIPYLQAKDVPKKIKNLRSSYYQELKRIENSKRPGAAGDLVYKPKVSWFKIADGYLKSCIRKEKISYIDENSISDGVSDDDSENPKTDATDDRVTGENSNPVSYNLILAGLNQQVEDSNCVNENIQFGEPSQTTKSQLTYSLQRSAKKLKYHSRDKYDNRDNIYEAINRIDEKLTSHNEEDEFDGFGKYIAISLRSLPRQLSIVAKVELQKTLSEIQLRSIGENASNQSQNHDNLMNSYGIDHSKYIMSTPGPYPIVKCEDSGYSPN